jgi:hypothetical protein
VIVGKGAPVEIGGWLGAGEHGQRSGKLARGSVRAMGTRWWLSTATRGSPERRSGRRRRLELGVCTTRGKEVQMVSLRSPSSVGQKRRGEELGVSTEHGGDDVAAGRRLGTLWHARRRAARRGTEPG